MSTQSIAESTEQVNPEHERVREFAQGLRELADFLDEHPEVGLPGYLGQGPSNIHIFKFFPCDRMEGLRRFARAVGRSKKSTDSMFFNVEADRLFGNIQLVASDYRDVVCKRVKKTRTVEKEVPTGEVVKREIEEPVTEKREVEETYFEWECPDSLLAEASA